MSEEREQIYKDASDKFDTEFQIDMAIEECLELATVLIKWKRGKSNIDNIIEECIDIRIMINQLEFIFPDKIKWLKWKRIKLNRLRSILYNVEFE